MNDTTPRGGLRTVRRRLLLAASAVVAAAMVPGPALADLVGVLPHIKPSIVAVGTYQRTRSPAFQFRGTGFVVGDGRLIVTNAHVLPDTVATDKMEALVIAVPGEDESAMARPVARIAADRERDLAVLRLEGGPALPALTLARDERAQEGQEIAFTGFPIGAVLGLTPVTHRGLISAITPIGIPQGKARDLNPALVRRLANDVFRVLPARCDCLSREQREPDVRPAHRRGDRRAEHGLRQIDQGKRPVGSIRDQLRDSGGVREQAALGSALNPDRGRHRRKWPRHQESNLDLALRRRPFYPLNYDETAGRAF